MCTSRCRSTRSRASAGSSRRAAPARGRGGQWVGCWAGVRRVRVSLCLAVFFASLDEGGGSGARKCFFELNTPPSPAARVLDSIAARPRPARRASHSHRNGFAARGCSASRSARCDSAPRLSRPQAARTFRLRPAHALWSYLSAENTLCPSAPPVILCIYCRTYGTSSLCLRHLPAVRVATP